MAGTLGSDKDGRLREIFGTGISTPGMDGRSKLGNFGSSGKEITGIDGIAIGGTTGKDKLGRLREMSGIGISTPGIAGKSKLGNLGSSGSESFGIDGRAIGGTIGSSGIVTVSSCLKTTRSPILPVIVTVLVLTDFP
jgi:hypothetical protein